MVTLSLLGKLLKLPDCIMPTLMGKTFFWIISGSLSLFPVLVFAQDEDLYFQALDVQGRVTAYHDQTDSTTPLRKRQVVDDGDWVMTGPKSQAILRLKDRAYLYLAPNTKIAISRLAWGEKGPNCQLKLLQGRALCQMDSVPTWPFDITAGNVQCAAHGVLFEISLKKNDVKVISFDGAVVAITKGRTRIAKTFQLLKYENGKFRYKNYHLKAEDENHAQQWKDDLEKILEKSPPNSN